MNYGEFMNEVSAKHARLNGEQRLGQVYFNLLYEMRPDIANNLRGAIIDPFYKERITQVVHDFVIARWDDEP